MIQDVFKLIEEKENLKVKLETVGNKLKEAAYMNTRYYMSWQEEELDKLYEQGFYCIEVCCMECDLDYEITNQKVLDDYKSYIKEIYKVVKSPDLTFEKL